jgi:predicted outer membrane repeat protein
MFRTQLVTVLMLMFSVALKAAIGINGAACQYHSFPSAIAAASSGDTLYIQPGNYISFIGEIDKDLTLVPGAAAPPGNTGCEVELTTADIDSVHIIGNDFSHDALGGMGKITNGAEVTMKHLTIRNAQADYGGILAVTGGSTLELSNVRLIHGVAAQEGGLVYVTNEGGAPSTLIINNQSELLHGSAVVHGGVISLHNSELLVFSSKLGGDTQAEASSAGEQGGVLYAVNSDVHFSNNQNRIVWAEAGLNGGGFSLIDSTTEIIDARMNNLSATFNGGGIHQSGGTLTYERGYLHGNLTEDGVLGFGGGIYVTGGALTLNGARIATNLAGANGGGIYGDTGSTILVMGDANIESNVAFGQGGGIYSNASVQIGVSELSSNKAFAEGGGLACDQCQQLSISNGALFFDNEASSGGGLYTRAGGSGGSQGLSIDGAVLEQNRAINESAYGGGALLALGGLQDIRNAQFIDNTSARSGGGIYYLWTGGAASGLDLHNVIMQGNTSTSVDLSHQGGAVYQFAGDVFELTNSLITDNHSNSDAGGLYLSSVDQINIADTVISENTAVRLGGGLSITGHSGQTASVINITDSQFILNAAEWGGAMGLRGGHTILRSVQFDQNIVNASGGAINASNDAYLRLVNNHLTGNQATWGGAIYGQRIGLDIVSEYGNGPDMCDPLTLGFADHCSVFAGNHASTEGGAIYYVENQNGTQRTHHIMGVEFAENTANARGSVFHYDSGIETVLEVHNVLAHHNSTATEPNSVFYLEGNPEVNFNSVTMADNLGSPISATDVATEIMISNSIVHNNALGPEVLFGVALQVNCNLSQPQIAATQSLGNNGDPQFITDARGPYRLAATSPSADACITGPVRDLDGRIRPGVHAQYDQGAFEMDGVGHDDVIFWSRFDL